MKHKIIIFSLILLLLLILYKIYYEIDFFTLDKENKLVNVLLKDYENIPVNNNIIYNIDDLLKIDNIKTDNNIIINIINSDSGLGSQLTIFMQYQHYFHELNKNIICLPHFSVNRNYFKYHENTYNNSFFLYFKKKIDINNLTNYKQYFVLPQYNIQNYPFFTFHIPILSNDTNKKYIDLFMENYKYIENPELIQNINNIKSNKVPLYGIHIRSIAQKKLHDADYLSLNIETRLINLKNKIEKDNNNYNIFIATDVNLYIPIAQKIFNNNIYFIDNIERIDFEEDSIPNISTIGYKVGFDILNECHALSMCDKIYVSNSNIPFIITLMNKNINMEEY